MAGHLAWSFSRLKTFKECPAKLWHTAVAPKGHPDRCEYVETAAMRAGTEVDNALTARISNGTPLPEKYQKFEPLAKMMLEQPGVKLTQLQLALDRSFKPCAYKDWDNAWVRVIYDIAVINGSYAFLGDWKNGQMWIDEDQLRLFAAVGFHQFADVDVIDTAYIWLKHGHISPKLYHRRDLPDMWQTFIPDVERMQIMWKAGDYPYTPSPRACGYCDANREGKCPNAAVKYKGNQS